MWLGSRDMCRYAQVSRSMRLVTTLSGSWAVVDLRARVPHAAFFRSFPLSTRRATAVHIHDMPFATMADRLCLGFDSSFAAPSPSTSSREVDISARSTVDLASLFPNTSLQTFTGPQIPSMGVMHHVVRLLPNLVRVAIACSFDYYNSEPILQLLLDELPHLRHVECPEPWMTVSVNIPIDDNGDDSALRLPPTLETLILLHDGRPNARIRHLVRGASSTSETPTIPTPLRLHTLRVVLWHGYVRSWNLTRVLAIMPALRDLELDPNICVDPLVEWTLLALPGLERLKMHMNHFADVARWPPLPEQSTLRRLDLDVACGREQDVTEGMRRILRSCTRMRELRVIDWSSRRTDCLLGVIAEHMDRVGASNALRYTQLPPFHDADDVCDALSAPGSRPITLIPGDVVIASVWNEGSYTHKPRIALFIPNGVSGVAHLLVPRPIDASRVDSIVHVEVRHTALRRILSHGGEADTACIVGFSDLRNTSARGLWNDRDAPDLVRGPKCYWNGTGPRETADCGSTSCVYDCICRAEPRKWRKNIANCAMTSLLSATLIDHTKNSVT
jgi:hypothetical protein